jgi:hypothetical protein
VGVPRRVKPKIKARPRLTIMTIRMALFSIKT